MSLTKRIIGDYQITNKDTYGANVTVSTHTLFVQGNMVVGGNTSVVTKTDTEITDNTITLNKGEAGAGVTLVYSGIEIDRGSLNNVSLRFNEDYDLWELTTDGTNYANITSGSTSAIGSVSDDPAPSLGGNLNITTKSLFDTSANVEVRANTAAMGGSGLYTNKIGVTNNKKELITKNRALVYSIIL